MPDSAAIERLVSEHDFPALSAVTGNVDVLLGTIEEAKANRRWQGATLSIFGDDSYLAARTEPGDINGVQSQGVAANTHSGSARLIVLE